LADATKDGFSGSSSTGLNGASGSSGSGSTSLGSSSYQSSISPSSSSTNTDNTAAKDLGSNAAALGNSVMASEVSFQLIYYRTRRFLTDLHSTSLDNDNKRIAHKKPQTSNLLQPQLPTILPFNPLIMDLSPRMFAIRRMLLSLSFRTFLPLARVPSNVQPLASV